MRTLAIALLALSLFTFTACSTYVNIPPQTGDVAGNDPNVTDVVTVQAKALRAVILDRPAKQTFVFMLPPGSNTRSYAQVQEELGDLAVHGIKLPDASAAAGSDNVATSPLVEVRQVMIRGWTAQVDVVRPSDPTNPQSVLQMVTVYLKWQFFDDWYVQRLHPWNMPVDDALRRSRQTTDTETPTGPGVNER
jgi:hypothetical protein